MTGVKDLPFFCNELVGEVSVIGLGDGFFSLFTAISLGLLFVGFVTCALTGAGIWYGLDYWLKDKISGKISKFLV